MENPTSKTRQVRKQDRKQDKRKSEQPLRMGGLMTTSKAENTTNVPQIIAPQGQLDSFKEPREKADEAT